MELDFVHIVLFLLGYSTDFLAEVPKGFPMALILVFLTSLCPAFLVALKHFLVGFCLRDVLCQVCTLLFELLVS